MQGAVSKDWWEEPPKEKHEFSTGSKVAAGTAAGLGLGAGAVLLATRGKGAKTITRTVTRTKKIVPKPPKAPEPITTLGGKKIRLKPKSEPKQLSLLNSKGQVPKVKATKKTAAIPVSAPVTPTHSPAAKAKHKTAGLKAVGEQRDDLARRAPDKLDEPYDESLVARAEPSVSDTERLKALAEADARAKQARAARRANAQMHGKPGANPRVKKNDAQIIAKRIMMDIQDDIFKASITGEQGDKRNTKYALAGVAGYGVGMNVGERVGARQAGTTWRENRRQANAAMHEYTTKKRAKLEAKRAGYHTAQNTNVPQMAANLTRSKKHQQPAMKTKPSVDPNTWKPSLGEIYHVNSKIKGTKQLIRGGQIGGALGLAAGAGGYAIYRYDKKKRRESPPMQAMLDARKAEEPVAKAFFRPKAAALALKPKAVQPPKVKTWSAADDMAKDKAIATQKARYAMRQTA